MKRKVVIFKLRIIFYIIVFVACLIVGGSTKSYASVAKSNYFILGDVIELQSYMRSIDDVPYYGKAYTDKWKGMPKSTRKHIGNLTIDQQIHNCYYIEYLLTHKGVGKSGKWTKQAASATIANIIVECGTNPGQWERWNKTTGMCSGYGLCQWTPSEKLFDRTKLKVKTANKIANDKPKKAFNKQIKYMWKTMSSKKYHILEWYGKMGVETYHSPLNITAEEYIKSKKSPEVLAKVFCACYLRPDKIKKELRKRSEVANDWFKNREIKEE